MMVYADSMQLHKVNEQDNKCNMNMENQGVREYLDEGVMLCLDKDNKDDFNVDIKTALITVLNNFICTHLKIEY